MLARALLLVLAGAAIAWLAVSAAGAHAEQQLTRLAFGAGGVPSAADEHRADVLTARAARLNPDPRVALYRGILDLRARRPAAAARVFARVAREQPEDVEVWALTGRAAAQANEPALAREAQRRVRALAPPVPPPPR